MKKEAQINIVDKQISILNKSFDSVISLIIKIHVDKKKRVNGGDGQKYCLV